ncbi:MAG TPA: hypothetical protein GXZ23_01240 [Clostridiales bacterium]|nr:hypothetical protein [Clostridiales bacterium]
MKNKTLTVLCAFIIIFAMIFVFSSCKKLENNEDPSTGMSEEKTTANTLSSEFIDDTTENTTEQTNASESATENQSETISGKTETQPATATGTTAAATSSVQQTSKPAENTTAKNKIDYSLEPVTPTVNLDSIDRKIITDYYVNGTFLTNGANPVNIEAASDGKTIFMHSNINGVDTGFILPHKITGSLYIINYEKKQYLSMSSSLMSIAGMKTEDLIDDDTFDSFTVYEFNSFGNTKPQLVNVGNEQCLKYGYIDGDSYAYFFFRSGEKIPCRMEIIPKSDSGDSLTIKFNSVITSSDGYLTPPADFQEIKFSLADMDAAMAFMEDMGM